MELRLEDFIKMEEIDHEYFDDENISPANEAYNWYLKDKNSCIVVKEKNQVIAYLNILSLKEEVFNKIKNDLMNESEVLFTDLELAKDKYFNYLYFSAIAIDKDFRNIKTLRLLLNEAIAKIKNILQTHNCKIIEVMADCSTKQGEKITQKFLKLKPYKKTSHDSTIHILKGKEFINNLNSYPSRNQK